MAAAAGSGRGGLGLAVALQQLRYALLLDWGGRIGLVVLVLSFAAYVLGLAEAHVPVQRLPELWQHPVARYLELTQTPTGWGWLALVRRGVPAVLWWEPEGGAPRAVAGAAEPYPAAVFEQVHPAMGDRVRSWALAELGAVARLRAWDLYAGVGETSALLAAGGAEVESVEVDARAVREAMRRGPEQGVRRHVGRAEDVVPTLVHLLGLPLPAQAEGKVIAAALQEC